MKVFAFVFCGLISAAAIGQVSEKQKLASQFYDKTTAKQIDAMTRNAANGILREDPTKVRQSEIYRQWAKESFSSPEYKNIYVQFLVENFNDEELSAMNEWAKDPVFGAYMNKWQRFPQWSAPKLQEFLRSKNPELARRLRAEGFDPNK
ncbi:MAG: hypothetical protein V4632_04770 [Pseudomonadota bacterium]